MFLFHFPAFNWLYSAATVEITNGLIINPTVKYATIDVTRNDDEHRDVA